MVVRLILRCLCFKIHPVAGVFGFTLNRYVNAVLSLWAFGKPNKVGLEPCADTLVVWAQKGFLGLVIGVGSLDLASIIDV